MSSCIMALLVAIALSSFIFTANPKGDLTIANLRVIDATVKGDRRSRDIAFVNFNVTADLTPLFHWNTKQLFVYLSAEYTNKEGTKNDVVIWDKILHREDAEINVLSHTKYRFLDIGRSFTRSSPVEFVLKYNLMPYVGMLTYGEAARTKPEPFPAKDNTL